MNKSTALIIEDHPELSEIFETVMEILDFETDVIKDGRMAKDIISSTQPDIILLDLHMPFVSGEELLYQIREDKRLSGTKVVIISADMGLIYKLKDQADEILIKPISFAQLEATILNLMAREAEGRATG